MTRICLVTHYMPPHRGGVERVAERLAEAYAGAGHEVTWVAASPGAASGASSEGRIERIRVPASNALERRFGMPYPIIPPSAAKLIRATVGRADVVHLHDCLYLPVVVADRAALRAGRPTIVTQHVGMVSFGSAVDVALELAYRTVGRSVLRHARHVAFVSQHVRDWFGAHVDASLRSELIPNGIDTDTFVPASAERRDAARRRLGLPTSIPVVLAVGRLVAKKNVATLVSALESIDQPWHALIVGDGPEYPRLARLAGRVTHVPDLPAASMPDVYAAADLFALPSVGEGMPLAVLEAMSAGLPTVLSDDEPFAPLADAGAVLVPATPAALATAIRSLLDDPVERARRGARARTWVMTHAAERTSLDRYLEILAEIAA